MRAGSAPHDQAFAQASRLVRSMPAVKSVVYIHWYIGGLCAPQALCVCVYVAEAGSDGYGQWQACLYVPGRGAHGHVRRRYLRHAQCMHINTSWTGPLSLLDRGHF